MKAALSTLISSKNFTPHSSSLCRSICLHPKPLSPLPAFLSPITPSKAITTNICISLSCKSQTRSANFSSVMVSTYKPEKARVSPALPLPTPPITKFKIALCQLLVTPDKERNISHARKAIADPAAKGEKKIQTACDVHVDASMTSHRSGLSLAHSSRRLGLGTSLLGFEPFYVL